jgi:hypothetical protein
VVGDGLEVRVLAFLHQRAVPEIGREFHRSTDDGACRETRQGEVGNLEDAGLDDSGGADEPLGGAATSRERSFGGENLADAVLIAGDREPDTAAVEGIEPRPPAGAVARGGLVAQEAWEPKATAASRAAVPTVLSSMVVTPPIACDALQEPGTPVAVNP